MTDPFAPVGPRFPRERLLRAGLDDEAVGNLAERFGSMSRQQQYDLARYVDSHTDQAIATRYGAGGAGTEAPTREQLDDLHVPELRDRLAARGQPVSGVKAELIDRLLASYEPAAEPPPAPPAEPQGDTVPEQQQAATALTGDAEQPQTATPAEGEQGEQGQVVTADGTTHTGEVPASAAQAPAEPAPAPAPAPEPTPAPAAPQAPAEPAAAPVEQPAAPAPVEPAPATLPAGSPGAPTATDAPAATPTPAAPAGGSTDTTGGTA